MKILFLTNQAPIGIRIFYYSTKILFLF